MHARNSSEFLPALNSIQARSQVFYGKVRSKKDTVQTRPKGQVSGGRGGSFGCLRLNCAASLQLGGGGVDFERVNLCHLGLSGGMLAPPPPPPTPYGLGNVLKTAIAIVVVFFIYLIPYFSNFVMA